MPLKKGRVAKTPTTTDLDVDGLIEDLAADSAEVRRKAAVLLEDWTRAGDAIVERFALEEDEAVLASLTIAVLRHPTEEGARALFDLIRGDDASKRTVAVDALRQMPSETLAFIEAGLDDPDPDVRILVANTLQLARIEGVAPAFGARLEEEAHPNVLAAIVEALLELGTESELHALEMLRDRLDEDDFLCFAVDAAMEGIRGRAES